jgi:hypothetical protein
VVSWRRKGDYNFSVFEHTTILFSSHIEENLMPMKISTWLLLIGFFVMTSDLKAQTCDFFVGGYVPSYRTPENVDYTKLSHAFYAFASTNDDGDLLIDEPAVFERFKTASAGKQRFLSIAGAGRDVIFSSMTSSASARATFVSNCVDACITHDLQGIDMDWEAIVTAADSAKYGDLMRELAVALHANDLTLVATLGYGNYGGGFYNVGALKEADWIQLMVYDQTGTWADSPYGNHASHQHMLDAIEYWKNRGYTDLSKIVIGVPFYGYKFGSTQGGIATAVTYATIAETYPGLACTRDDTFSTFFNGPETIRKKVLYVKEHGLKGIMIWEMAQDLPSDHEKSLLNAISRAACDLPASCSPIVSVSEDDLTEQVLITKNPVNDFLSLQLDDENSVSSLKIVDVTGSVWHTKNSPLQKNEYIDVSAQSSGMYLLRIEYSNRKTVLKKFVKY